MSRSCRLFFYKKNLFFFHFSNFSQTDNTLFYNQHNAVYSLQQRNRVDFGLCPDSVVLSVKDLDENLTISSLEFPLAAWSLLLSQRQEFLDNHLPRVPIAPSQQGTIQMREEVLSSVGAQDTDARGYERSDIEDIEFSWEDPAMDLDSVYRPGIDTPFYLSNFDNFQMGGGSTTANPIMVDDEEDKENSAPTTTTPESERPNEPPRLLSSRPFWNRIESVLDSVYGTLFRYIFCVFEFDTFYEFCLYK